MSVWYEAEKTKEGLASFLDCNWSFHDFRLEHVLYVPGKDMVEIFLKYDTGQEGVLLRFTGINGVHVNTDTDYDAAWLCGSVILCLDNDSLIWLDDDDWGENSLEHLDDLKQTATWVESKRLFWAVTDADGNPVEMPDDRVDQLWYDNGKTEVMHFKLKEFDESWDAVLLPWYKR